MHAPQHTQADARAGFTLRGVSVVAGTAVLLRDLDLDIAPRAWTALIGPSGSGKTTLLRVLNRLAEPSAGTVCWNGRALPEYDVRALRREVGLVVQQPRLGAGRVRDSLDLPHKLGAIDAATARDRVARACEVAQLDARLLDRELSALSGGERQRVALARALMLAPRALLLDEPTAALDRGTAQALLRALDALRAEQGMTLVAATHRLEELTPFGAAHVALAHGAVEAA
jgi:ABC-type methionine transport system ATPase subunit